MTPSQMFREAHKRTREDMISDAAGPAILRHSYAYYFRLQLRNLQALKRDSNADLVIGFQVIEPRRLWA